MKDNLLFFTKFAILILIIQSAYLSDNTTLIFLMPLLALIVFLILIRHTKNKNVDNWAKILSILFALIFSIYNISNCIRLSISNNEANNYIKKIEVNNNNEYLSLLNEYKSLYNVQKGKGLDNTYEEEYKTNYNIYSTKNRSSVFTYDRAIYFIKGGIVTTDHLILIRTYESSTKDNQDVIRFLNSMTSNLELVANQEKIILISLIINILFVNLTVIYYIKHF